MSSKKIIPRDISWLSFNARVLQEAADTTVPLYERLRFLGIFSNNMDEFFRVRVASLTRLQKVHKHNPLELDIKPEQVLKQIQQIVQEQQNNFNTIYKQILKELNQQNIFLITESQLKPTEKKFVEAYFNEKVRTNIVPLMIESIPQLPNLQDKSIYLACVLSNSDNSFMNSYALIEIPSENLPRFIILPQLNQQKRIILLEDIIRFCLPQLFSQFGFNQFQSFIIKVTKDAELDIDNDISMNMIEQLEKGIKNRKKGKTLRFIYDKTIDKNLLKYLVKLLNINHKDHLNPSGRIHNYKDFMNFPAEVFEKNISKRKSFTHPLFVQPVRIMDVLNKSDVMLHFPYHSFDSVIDLLREAAIDPYVEQIRITAYRLAKESKVINALINAVRNGKNVEVVLELKARFDEAANLKWKQYLEEEGVKVRIGFPDKKIHAKLCVITKRINKRLKHYGFISTGNLNESTAKLYGDHCLMTANQELMKDALNVFQYIQKDGDLACLKKCKHLIVSPLHTRSFFQQKIQQELKHKKKHCIFKLNSLSDNKMVQTIQDAAEKGLELDLIARSIFTSISAHKSWPQAINAISIVDEYLEHARVFYFYNNGKNDMYISSADWMLRNLDYRVEVSTPIFNENIKNELLNILQLQLQENVKARILDNQQNNLYKKVNPKAKKIRAQVEIFNYLKSLKY